MFSIHVSIKVHPTVEYVSTSFIFTAPHMFHNMYIPHFICQLMDIRVVSIFWLLLKMPLWTLLHKCFFSHTSFYEDKFSFFLGVYIPRNGIMPGHMVTLCLTFCRIPRLFSKYKVAVPFYTPTTTPWGFWLLHVFANTCYNLFLIIAIWVGMRWYFVIFLLAFP